MEKNHRHHHVSTCNAKGLSLSSRSLEEIYKASGPDERKTLLKGGLALTGFSLLIRLLIKI